MPVPDFIPMTHFLSQADWVALALTLELALFSTVLLLILACPLAWWLAHGTSRLRIVVETMVALPLVLPPTVMGFYLLLLLGPQGWVGQGLMALGLEHLAFRFSGLVVGSMVYSLPFAVQPLRDAFKSQGQRILDVAATLGASPLDRFFSVGLPLARSGLLTATVLSFAHTLGEFGVILMIGGSLPGQTRVASIAIYDHVEAMDYGSAHALALVLAAIAFALLLLIYFFNRRFPGPEKQL